MGPSGFLWQIRYRTQIKWLPYIEAVLEPVCDAVIILADEDAPIETGIGTIEGFVQDEPDRQRLRAALATVLGDELDILPEPLIDLVPPKDWVAENVAQFPPLPIGRFYIHGSHVVGPLPPATIALKLDAGTAFGSGEHGSTAGCLLELQTLAKQARPKNILDMGCGSGILAIASAKLWRQPILASDIDPESARVTRANATRNDVGQYIQTTHGPGYAAPGVSHGRPYDLITANILARPLRAMANDLGRHLAPGGHAVLSGLLSRDAAFVITAQAHAGLRLVRHRTINRWRTLVFKKPF